MVTTIQLDESIKKKLDSLKVHHRETYNELLKRLIQGQPDEEKESLIETLETMSDPETMRNIAEAMEEINKGNLGQPLDEVRKELGV